VNATLAPKGRIHMSLPRNIGTAKQACAIADVAPSTLRNWLRDGLISAVRVGPRGRIWYDLDDVASMRVEVGKNAEQRIRELVDSAPEFTLDQVNKIRLLLHAGPPPSGGDMP
jgi:MerR HTH family regulatory protein